MRLPFEPVALYLGGNDGTQAEHLGVTRRTVQRYKRDGLSLEHAELMADRLGQISYELWPEILDAAIDAALVECAAGDCGERFHPQWTSRKKRRYCSRRCQVRANKRLQRLRLRTAA